MSSTRPSRRSWHGTGYRVQALVAVGAFSAGSHQVTAPKPTHPEQIVVTRAYYSGRLVSLGGGPCVVVVQLFRPLQHEAAGQVEGIRRTTAKRREPEGQSHLSRPLLNGTNNAAA